ncbi:hypothetical protein COLO4_05335 [Corchorus olitorius]|uniref:Uncharacterized protein n=1 Tax=Corchorus olitorius TaxID=93759 RepID=A0A1R3KRC0_9ROSI|nr:hypothetical protein COLO4_05335 [Corchorus olitorius]
MVYKPSRNFGTVETSIRVAHHPFLESKRLAIRIT